MSNNVSNLFDSAEFALAEYATLLDGPTNDQANIDALEDAGMSQRQAEEFAVLG